MTLKYAILTLLFFASLCIHATADDTASTFDMSDTITTIKSASDTLTGKKQNDIKTFLKNWQEPYDTTRDEGYWKRALVHRKFDINDKSVKYPSFIDFCIFKPRWLFNVTVTPGIGYRHSYSNSIEGSQSMLSTNYRIRLALVHNRGNYFYGLHAISAGSWYRSNQHSFFHSQHNVSVTAGYRF